MAAAVGITAAAVVAAAAASAAGSAIASAVSGSPAAPAAAAAGCGAAAAAAAGASANAAVQVKVDLSATMEAAVSYDGTVTTVAGVGREPGDDDGVGPAARFAGPSGMAWLPAAEHGAEGKHAPEVVVSASSPSNAPLLVPRIVTADLEAKYRTVSAGDGTYLVHTLALKTPADELLDRTMSVAVVAHHRAAGDPSHAHHWLLAGDSSAVWTIDLLHDTAKRLAGSIKPGYADGKLLSAQFSDVSALLPNHSGAKIFVADNVNHRLRLIDVHAGVVSTVAGNGKPEIVDGVGPAAATARPRGMCWDPLTVQPETALYFTSETRLRRFDTLTGAVTTVPRFGEDASAGVGGAYGLAATPSGVLLVCAAHAVWAVDPVTGAHDTVAGGDEPEEGFEDGKADDARFSLPISVLLHPDPKLHCAFVADHQNACLRRIQLSPALFVPLKRPAASGSGSGSRPSSRPPSAGTKAPEGKSAVAAAAAAAAAGAAKPATAPAPAPAAAAPASASAAAKK